MPPALPTSPPVVEAVDHYAAQFQDFLDATPSEPPFLGRLRREALDRFRELGFPTPQMEAWRNTSLENFTTKPYQRPALSTPGPGREELQPYTIEDAIRVVLVDGRFAPELSDYDQVPPGIRVQSLAAALRDQPAVVAEHLGRIANFHDQALVALNTAFIEDGVFIEVEENSIIEQPIHYLYLSSGGTAQTFIQPRNLIIAGCNSQAAIVEHHLGWGGEGYFSNTVTEIISRENAVLKYVKIQQDTSRSGHLATTQIHQERHSQVRSHSISCGAGLQREDLNLVFAGEGSGGTLRGLVLADGKQHVDHHTTINHVAPHCTSQELYKGIYAQRSHGVFNGRIVVRPEAQQTDADQLNKNILLSDKALVNSNPQLEIYADDVKCSHGSTTGQVDEEAIFYLRSRGIAYPAALHLLIHGFANEIIATLPAARDYVVQVLDTWLKRVRLRADQV